MTAPAQLGPCCLLLDATAAERSLLASLPRLHGCPADRLEAAVAECGDGVDVVVIGAEVAAPVTVLQRAHRAVPDAGVVVLTRGDTAEQLRRAIGFAPGVPLDVRIVAAAEPAVEEVALLRAAVAQQRRHRALLAAVSSRAQASPRPQPRLQLEIGALLEHAPLGVLVCDGRGSVVGWNRRAAELLEVPARSGSPVEELLPGAAGLIDAAGGRAGAGVGNGALALTTAGGVDVDVSAVTSQLDDGQPAVLLLVVDVTQRRVAERARDRLAGHVSLLGRVSETLTTTLDTTLSLHNLASALVPDLADWTSIQLLEASGSTGVVVMRHRDPALAAVVAHAQERQAVAAAEAAPSRRAARGGEALLVSDVDEASLAAFVPDPELRALVTQLGAGSAIAVPLPGRDHVLGSLVLVNGPDSPPLSEAELAVAVEVGRRAGVALDNARLYAQQRDLATELQRSLLTAPPQPANGQIVVRYVAAAQEAQVGGDWYDAFLQPDGATVLVIGDVVGHDTAAAAGMSQLRGVLRGIAFTTGGDPADVLSRLDCAVEGLLISTTATAVVARLEQEPASSGQGRTWVRWSNAGHPPPIVIDSAGRATILDDTPPGEPAGEADLLLGIDPSTARTTHLAALDDGATLLLYTDGLVERRGQSLDEGVAALLDAVSGCAALTLDELCDTALRRLLPQEPEDDVALVALRLHPRRSS